MARRLYFPPLLRDRRLSGPKAEELGRSTRQRLSSRHRCRGVVEGTLADVEEAPAPFTAVADYSPRNPLMGSNPAAGGAQLWGIRSLVVAEVALAVMLILPAETYPDGAPVSFLQPVA
ncbi:MAG: hypothetical protein IIB90_16660 [Gemmatimonadetes bacterium]|nr:hypothetical protein [Gemmatimonadota bacterium]